MRLVQDTTRYDAGIDLYGHDGRPEGGFTVRQSDGCIALEFRSGGGPLTVGGNASLTREQLRDIELMAKYAGESFDAWERDQRDGVA